MRRALFVFLVACGNSPAGAGIRPSDFGPTPVAAAPTTAASTPTLTQAPANASLKIMIGGTAPQGTYTVTVDGQPIPPERYSNVPVSAGTHKVAYSYIGRFGTREQVVDVQPGEQKEVTLTVMMKH